MTNEAPTAVKDAIGNFVDRWYDTYPAGAVDDLIQDLRALAPKTEQVGRPDACRAPLDDRVSMLEMASGGADHLLAALTRKVTALTARLEALEARK